ncbi:putative membrane protein [Chryseobacterium sp. PvR013]|uniref:SHOCT domain-containing protein n=1 Tax=Chryseobacterium sp. PvR013 TaxID=2806595 RepID=UPI001AEB5D3E|nr:SHOCT domain-containing protein [Chryseobacterium sp. PvR013]MBP1165294.1 putative membrane protein [Chryseobacterium sp. PvR013]
MYYDHYQFWGMHFGWWIIWMLFLFWIFFTPYSIPGQKSKKETPIDILNKRLASGQIDKEEYEEKKKMLEK